MSINFSQIVGREVRVAGQVEPIAAVADAAINKQTGQLIALVVKPPHLWQRQLWFLLADDIADITAPYYHLERQAQLKQRHELSGRHFLPRQWKALGLAAESAMGEPLGRVVDLTFDNNGLQVTDFVCQRTPVPYLSQFLPKRIISWERIIKITDRRLVADVDPRQPLLEPQTSALPVD